MLGPPSGGPLFVVQRVLRVSYCVHMNTAERHHRLVSPPQDIVDRLAMEEHVSERDVRDFSASLDGLTPDQGIALLNDLAFRRSWNSPTFMAANELLAAVSP